MGSGEKNHRPRLEPGPPPAAASNMAETVTPRGSLSRLQAAVSAGALSPYRSCGPHRVAGYRYTALNRTLGRETTVSAHVHALRIFYASRKRPMAYADDGFVQYTYWSATFVKSDVRGPACDEQWVFALCR